MRKEEIIYGAWVRIKDDGSPVQVISFDEENVAVVGDGDIRATRIEDLRPLEIGSQLLEGFGFRRAKGDNVWMRQAGDMRLTVSLRMRFGVEECRRCAISGKIACWNEEIRFMHELQRWWNDRVYFVFDIPLELEWHE